MNRFSEGRRMNSLGNSPIATERGIYDYCGRQGKNNMTVYLTDRTRDLHVPRDLHNLVNKCRVLVHAFALWFGCEKGVEKYSSPSSPRSRHHYR